MIAVVSSTIKPLIKEDKSLSFYSFDERLEQTRQTLTRLLECGFDSISLVDNSPLLDQSQLQQLLSDFPEVKVYHLLQYQFLNKGINELLMLLFLIERLPPDQNIFKISGRYYPSQDFKKPDFVDFAVRAYYFKEKSGVVTTRGYWVKDAATFHQFLLWCLDELFAYPERIVGVKSLYKKLFVEKNPDDPLNISIEFAAANVLKSGYYNVTLLDNIGIEGLLAGAENSKVAE
jgi:hypothetical protein